MHCLQELSQVTDTPAKEDRRTDKPTGHPAKGSLNSSVASRINCSETRQTSFTTSWEERAIHQGKFPRAFRHLKKTLSPSSRIRLGSKSEWTSNMRSRRIRVLDARRMTCLFRNIPMSSNNHHWIKIYRLRSRKPRKNHQIRIQEQEMGQTQEDLSRGRQMMHLDKALLKTTKSEIVTSRQRKWTH